MRQTLAATALALRSRRGRILGLLAFGALFLLGGVAARLLLRGPDGDVHLDQLFAVGGYTAASAALLSGWLLGRLPLITTLVLMAGIVSDDRRSGVARLLAVRPTAPIAVYATRFAVLALLAFAIAALVMPLFDLLLLGTWAGVATLVLIAAYVLAYGGLVALLSVWTRGDAWIALLLAIAATVWAALLRAGALPIGAGPRQFITLMLPPQHALFRLEGAFANLEPIPWDAFAFAAGYGVFMLILAGASLHRRQL